MALLKCKICGGNIQPSDDKTFGVCEYCGCTVTLPKLTGEHSAEAFNRGNRFRMAGEFDKALSVYERIIEEEPDNAEAHWCCALCRFGIEWVEDPATLEYLPTCHRASFDPFTEDVDCKAAVELSDGLTRRQYQRDSARIAEVQRGILATSQNEKPFDVFICYKETDENGSRTVDSTLAQDIYYQLTDQGLRVFFARITLEDKAGSEYEPYIFAALNSARAMVVVGTRPEYFNAVWVKNEWSRFLSIVKRDRSKVLLPCYRGMDPYDLPDQLSILQSYDMSKIGFIQDLIRGIKKIVNAGPKAGASQSGREAPLAGSAPSAASLLARAFIFLEDGKWREADAYCEKVLDIDPKNASAYLGKLMAELQVRTRAQLADCSGPFDNRDSYRKIIRFGDASLTRELSGYIAHINERNENARLNGTYNRAVSTMESAHSESAYKYAADIFRTVPGFKDADTLAARCLEKAEQSRLEAIYQSAQQAMTGARNESEFKSAAEKFETIPGFKDADELAAQCREKAEFSRQDAVYQRAQSIMTCARDEAVFKSAAEQFGLIPGFKDSDELAEQCLVKAEECRKDVVFGSGASQMTLAEKSCENADFTLYSSDRYKTAIGFYESAAGYFETVPGWKDSDERAYACRGKIEEIRGRKAELDATADAMAAVAQKRKSTLSVSQQLAQQQAALSELRAISESFESKIDELKRLKADVRRISEKIHTLQLQRSEYGLLYVKHKRTIDAEIHDRTLTVAACEQKAERIEAELKGFKTREDLDKRIAETESCVSELEYLLAPPSMALSFVQALRLYLSDREIKTVFVKKYPGMKDAFDYYTFGYYLQTADGACKPLEWSVLDEKDGRILLISRYALECRPYHTSQESVTWKTCSLRKWLNGKFFNAAFESQERKRISLAAVTAEKNPLYGTSPGSDTKDRVFLLSVQETYRYFGSDGDRQCLATGYANAQCAEQNKMINVPNRNCFWWLRSPGNNSENAAIVATNGVINNSGVFARHSYGYVRPAVWIEIDS